VVEAYADGAGWVMANPVGTGPFRLKDWRRGQRIVLEANPAFRDELYPESSHPDDRSFAKLRGRKLPLVGRVEISIIEESNPRLLAFEQGDLDYVAVPPDLVPNVLDPGNKLKPRFVKEGSRSRAASSPRSPIRISTWRIRSSAATRRTRSRCGARSAWRTTSTRRFASACGQAFQRRSPCRRMFPATTRNSTVTPSSIRPRQRPCSTNSATSTATRTAGAIFPDGKPLVLKIATGTTALDRQYSELWQRSMSAVGLRVEFNTQKFADNLKAARLGQLQMWFLGNISTTTEGFGFLGLLYGGNAGFSNLARFKLPEFDRRYEEARAMPDGPERTKILQRMSELVTIYAPWNLHAYRYENVLVQPWLVGYKYNAFNRHPWAYYDVDSKRRKSASQ
jgi:ABC-type transport system substrate-binding protein